MNVPRNSPPPGYVLAPATAIGSLAVVLAIGLGMLEFSERADAVIASWLDERGAAAFPHRLPEWMIWLAGALIAYALSLAMLAVPGIWRRLVLWITALILVIAWAPVLALSARQPTVSTGIVTVLWSGVCSLMYASRHRMECDENPNAPRDGPR